MAEASKSSITLMDGTTVVVQPIRWSAWQDVKAAFARLLGSKLLPEVFRGLEALDMDAGSSEAALSDSIAAFLTSVVDRHQDGLSLLLADAIRDGGDLAELFVGGCVPGDVAVFELAAMDALTLAEAAISASDLPGLLGREKNFWAAVVTAATSGATKTGTTAD